MLGKFLLVILISFYGVLHAEVDNYQLNDTFTDLILQKRSVKSKYEDLWSSQIKYYIKNNYDPYGMISQTLDDIERHTCIRFSKQSNIIKKGFGIIFEDHYDNKNKNEPKKNEPVKFVVPRECRAKIGCYKKKMLKILLSSNLKRKKSNDIDIHQGQSDAKRYFENRDFSSVILSGCDLEKLTNIPPYYVNMLGYKEEYSFNDVKLLNARYCQSICSFNCLPCLNDGYQSPNDCSVCTCPPGYKGKFCEYFDDSDETCPKYNYLAQRKKQTITLCGSRDCVFLIQAPKGYKIAIEIDYSLSRKAVPCYKNNGIQFKYQRNKGKSGLVLCGYYENITLPAKSNEVLVTFKGRENAIALSFSYYTIFDDKDCYNY